MKITPYGNDGLCFLVDSRTRPGHHMVNLGDYNKNGQCSCEDFKFNCLPIYRVSHTPRDEGSARTRCEHIKACREWRLNDVIDRLETIAAAPAEFSPRAVEVDLSAEKIRFEDLSEIED